MLPIKSNILRKDWLTDLVFLGILFLIFYILWLGSYPLFTPDEGRYSEVAREMIASSDYITPRVDGVAFLDKPILYYWLQTLAIHLFGIKEWALRLFPVLFAVFGSLITYVCGRYLFDRRTGLLAAIILATSPLYFGNAHYANLDLEIAVLISCTLLFFLMGMHTENRSRIYWFLAAYTCAALSVLTKGLIGIAFPCLIIGSWIVLLSRFSILKSFYLVRGLVLFLALVLPWFILVQKANPAFFNYFFINQQVSRFLSAGVYNNPVPFWFYLPIVLAGFFPWTIFLIQALNNIIRRVFRAPQQHSVELFLLLWLGIVFVFFSIPTSKTIGYILPIFPALALLTGSYLARIFEKAQQKTVYLSIVNFIIIGGLFAGLLLILPHYQWLDFAPRFNTYLKILAILFILSAVFSLFSFKANTLKPLFIICTTCSVLFLMTLTLGAKHLNQNTAKPLVAELRTIIKPQDEVITYFKYYQDIPLYLGKRVSIVANWQAKNIAARDNWARELWYGLPFQKTNDWLINEETFWTRWNGNKRVFVFVNTNYFDQFKSHATSYFYLARYNDIILLSNQPTITQQATSFTQRLQA